ncbi:MAG TPA: CocE/NonD family hydrolase [Candidatus Binatia bacterium]
MHQTKLRAVLKILLLPTLLALVSACSDSDSSSNQIITAVLEGQTISGQAIPCVTEADGVRVCQGDMNNGPGGADLRFRSFDGVPLAVWVTLPPVPVSGPDGGYPLVVQNHGWGAPPSGPNDGQYGGPTATQWAQDGYAVLQFAARGWGNSCGTPDSRAVNPDACAKGYIRLDDYRYEVRDVQHAVGLLVDEGIVDPERIGATGESYGAGVSLALATLKNRIMNPDGSFAPWTSPGGTPLSLAAAAPFAGWSDLGYSLRPNGRTRTDAITPIDADVVPPGVQKQSINTGLFGVGALFGYYAAPGSDPDADVVNWFAYVSAGEPYDPVEDARITEHFTRFRSPYYLLAGAYGAEQVEPAPVLIANGFTDDIFPADEALRYANLARSLYPSYPIALLLFDVGHPRSNSKASDVLLLRERIYEFFEHYVKGTGPQPTLGVTALTQTCPPSEPSGGPYVADTWEALHPGVVEYRSAEPQTILSTGGNPAVAQAFDPVEGGLACTTAPGEPEGEGVATYDLPTVTGEGFTLLGSPTVTADLTVTGEYAYIAARLVDVDPASNTKTLIARALYRIDPAAPNGRQTFQLHANGWHFAEGHVPRLELLGRDAPYARPSNGTFSIEVSNLELRLPIVEAQ